VAVDDVAELGQTVGDRRQIGVCEHDLLPLKHVLRVGHELGFGDAKAATTSTLVPSSTGSLPPSSGFRVRDRSDDVRERSDETCARGLRQTIRLIDQTLRSLDHRSTGFDRQLD
jgi:hypothetical protein